MTFTLESLGFKVFPIFDPEFDKYQKRLPEEKKKRVDNIIEELLNSDTEIQSLIDRTFKKYDKSTEWLPKWLAKKIGTLVYMHTKLEYELLKLKSNDNEFDDLWKYARYISQFKVVDLLNRIWT
jgi:hypothetical protein